MRRFKVSTAAAESELLDLFTFHVAREQVAFLALADAASASDPAADPGYGFFDAPEAPAAAAADAPEKGYGFFDNAPGAPGKAPALASEPAALKPVAAAAKPAPPAPAPAWP